VTLRDTVEIPDAALQAAGNDGVFAFLSYQARFCHAKPPQAAYGISRALA